MTSAPASAASASAASITRRVPVDVTDDGVELGQRDAQWADLRVRRRPGPPWVASSAITSGRVQRYASRTVRVRPPPRHGDPGGRMGSLPPQRRQAGGPGGGPGGRPRATSAPARARRRPRSARPPVLLRRADGAGHRSAASRASSRSATAAPLPTCPQCGEIVWAYLEGGDRGRCPRASEPGAAPEAPQAAPSATVEEGVKLAPAGHRDGERQASALTLRWLDGARSSARRSGHNISITR